MIWPFDKPCKKQKNKSKNATLKQNVVSTFSKAKSWLDNNELVLNVSKTEILQF
jgi:hypothetical protein